MAICQICGGWARRLPEHGSHELCVALKNVGLPTPSLGEKCERCDGSGHVGKAKSGPLLSFDLGPAAIKRSIEACFPTCPDCNGRGIK